MGGCQGFVKERAFLANGLPRYSLLERCNRLQRLLSTSPAISVSYRFSQARTAFQSIDSITLRFVAHPPGLVDAIDWGLRQRS